MTLLKRHLEAGWREVESTGAKRVAEKTISLPGKSSSILREEAETQEELHRRLDTREMLLGGDPSLPVRDTVTDDGSLVTAAQHTALKMADVPLAESAPEA